MERKQSKLSGFFNVINKLEDIVLALLVIGMVIVIMLQIVGRVTGRPFPWTEETSRYLFLWMMFVALASGFNRCESSRVTLLLQIGPRWLKKFSEVLYAVVVLGFFAFMFIYGLQVVQQQVQFHEMGTALRIPMYFIGICQPVGAFLGFIGTIQSFLEYHKKIIIGDKETEKQKDLENER
jgi:TRAP-type C4-dicarboxylate transport system permease small subunit